MLSLLSSGPLQPLSLAPLDRVLTNPVILKENHWMLYWLVTAMYPQFLITLDENDEEQDVTVRVGQAVNTVGLAGTRSGISGVSVFSSFFFFFLFPLPVFLSRYHSPSTPLGINPFISYLPSPSIYTLFIHSPPHLLLYHSSPAVR
jgi:hypothetical protein